MSSSISSKPVHTGFSCTISVCNLASSIFFAGHYLSRNLSQNKNDLIEILPLNFLFINFYLVTLVFYDIRGFRKYKTHICLTIFTGWSCLLHLFLLQAVIEDVPLKQEIFSVLEKVCSSCCILATNTSSIDLNVIGEKTKSQDRIIGAHFFRLLNLF